MTAGDQVDFAAKLRDPEVMNDIGGFEAELHIGSGGNVNLVGRRKAQFWIAHLPPPLVSDDDDVIAAGLRRWVGGVHNVERKPEDHRQQKCGRNDIRKLPRCAAEDLLGIGLAWPRAKLPAGIRHQAGHQQKDRERDPKHPRGQLVD